MVISRLAHVAIGAEPLEENMRFYGDLLGVAEVARADGTVYLSTGRKPGFDLALGPWPQGLDHFSFQVESRRDLEDAKNAVGDFDELNAADEYGVEAGIRFVLPSGHVLELVVLAEVTPFTTVTVVDRRHHAGAGPVDLEHITVNVDDVEESSAYLTERLGFRVTEASRRSGQRWFNAFLRCRDIHHDLAVFHQHGDATGPGLDHYGFVVPSLEGIVRAADAARSLGHFLQCSPGRHLAGDNLFVYLLDPAGNRVEIGTPLARIDPAAEPRIFEARSDADWRGIFDVWREGIPPAVREPNPCYDGRAAAGAN